LFDGKSTATIKSSRPLPMSAGRADSSVHSIEQRPTPSAMAAQLTMYVVRKKGALVREGASLDTHEIADLAPGTRCESDAIETLPYGKKRVRLVRPVAGWVSAISLKAVVVEAVPAPPAVETIASPPAAEAPPAPLEAPPAPLEAPPAPLEAPPAPAAVVAPPAEAPAASFRERFDRGLSLEKRREAAAAPATPPRLAPLPAATFSPGGAGETAVSAVVARPLGAVSPVDEPPPPPSPRAAWAPRSPAVVASEAERTIRDAVAASSPHYRQTHTREVLAKIPGRRRPLRDWTNVPRADAGKPRGKSVVTALDSGSLADTAAWAAGDSPRSKARRRFEEAAAAEAAAAAPTEPTEPATPAEPATPEPAVPEAAAAEAAATPEPAVPEAAAAEAAATPEPAAPEAAANVESAVPEEPTPEPAATPEPATTPEFATTPAELSRTELPWSAAEPATPTSPPADDPFEHDPFERLYDVKIDATYATPAAELGRAKARPAWRLAEGALSPPRVVAALAPTTPKGRKRLATMFVALVVFGATNLLSSFWGLGGGQKPYAPGTPVRLRGRALQRPVRKN